MAKKKTTVKLADHPQSDVPESDGPVAADQEAADQADAHDEQSPEVRNAADAVRAAEAELKKAQQLYRQVRQKATNRLKAVREKSVGELIDGTLNTVKKHPGPGVIVAVVIGFFLGRIFRR